MRQMPLFVLLSMALLGENAMVARKKDSLTPYRTRRSTKKSGEPAGKTVPKKRSVGSKGGKFVIQKHAASHLHYDVRLEIEGVLVSWAVPKGPSTDPATKHLAIRTDDHPLAYGRFEGVIPEGNYGAGTVMIWDAGTYKNIKIDDEGKPVPLATCLKRGQIEVFLQGAVLSGGYALIKLKGRSDDWLLVKMRDEHAHKPKNPTKTVTKSAKSGKTMKELAQSSKSELS